MLDVTASYGKLLDFITFLGIFIHYYSCLKYCIFNKLSQIVCLINIQILNVKMPSVTAGYGRFSALITFFRKT